MWLKINYSMISPALIKPYNPFDGIFSFYYATSTGFKYRGKEGYIYDNLPISLFGYIDELPFRRTYLKDGRWFYNISGIIPERKIEYATTGLIRKFVLDTELAELRGISKVDLESFVSRGKEKAYKNLLITAYTPEFSILCEIDDEKYMEVINIFRSIQFIGKKVNQGYGQIKYKGYEEVEVNGFRFNNYLIRPIPNSLIEDNEEYGLIKSKLFAPYYVKNEKYSEVCYVDKKLLI